MQKARQSPDLEEEHVALTSGDLFIAPVPTGGYEAAQERHGSRTYSPAESTGE
jgi:hypothetical protein